MVRPSLFDVDDQPKQDAVHPFQALTQLLLTFKHGTERNLRS